MRFRSYTNKKIERSAHVPRVKEKPKTYIDYLRESNYSKETKRYYIRQYETLMDMDHDHELIETL